MKTTVINICQDCLHLKTCVLTSQKDKVSSCSEFESAQFFDIANTSTKTKRIHQF